MQNFLNQVQADKAETKIMNAILSCYQEVKQHEKMIIEIQQKLNEIIKGWNEEVADEDAEEENAAALNPDISEDMIQEDDLVEYTGAAVQEVKE